jgi:hypothetical protein
MATADGVPSLGGGYVMFANVAHYTALYDHVAAKTGSETSALLLSYGPYIYFLLLMCRSGCYSVSQSALQEQNLTSHLAREQISLQTPHTLANSNKQRWLSNIC